MLTTTASKTGDAGGEYAEVELGNSEPTGTDVEEQGSVARSPSKLNRMDVKWSKVNFKAKDKQILNDCWGHVPNGKLMAIMVRS